jgi:hypothetical protein
MEQSFCPSLRCRAANPMQALLTPTMIDAIGEAEFGRAIRCSACGCVYTVEAGGLKKVHGHFNRGCWKPMDS